MPPKTYKYKLVSGEDFGKAALETLQEAFDKARTYPLVVLPTGNTPKPLYAAWRQTRAIPYDFRYVNLDQYRGIKFSDPRSYPLEIKREVLDPLNQRLDEELIFDGNSDPKNQADKVETALKIEQGIDICILGIGQNGHIGFNEPYSEFNSRTRSVQLTHNTIEANKRHCEAHGGVPKDALTLGLGTIMEAKKIILLSNKPEITVKALHGRIMSKIPASILQRHPDVTVVGTPMVSAQLRLAR